MALRAPRRARSATDAERRQFRVAAFSRRCRPQCRCRLRLSSSARHPGAPDGRLRAAAPPADHHRHRRRNGGHHRRPRPVHGRAPTLPSPACGGGSGRGPRMSAKPLFERVALIGIGLVGSSLARVLRRDSPETRIVACARHAETLATVHRLDLADETTDDPAAAVNGADLVVIATPLSAYAEIARRIASALRDGAIVTDVGSVKGAAISELQPNLPARVHFVPGHPVAGTEHSGPEAGFAELFQDRWCILTPLPDTAPDAVAKVSRLWEGAGMRVVTMAAEHHDKVLAVTSHLPHLIAYTIVGTATELGSDLQSEVVAYSAGGFRDFTRIAASDPVMWRDIFLSNREAVLELLQRFSEDLTALQRAIRRGDGDTLHQWFTRTRAIRRSIIEAKQA